MNGGEDGDNVADENTKSMFSDNIFAFFAIEYTDILYSWRFI